MANIYGDDTNSFAESISSDALGSPSSNSHSGSREAGSKGNSPDPGEVTKTSIGTGNDSRAATKGNK